MSHDVSRMWQETAKEARSIAERGKDPMVSIERLTAVYGELTEGERAIVNKLIMEELLSDDDRVRYDSLWIVSDFLITDALPTLHLLSERLSISKEVGAPFEREKVDNIVTKLVKASERNNDK